MNIDVTPTQLLACLGVVSALVVMWRVGSARARKAAETARAGARVVSLAGRVLAMAAIFVGVQWVVITYTSNTTLLLVALAAPDLVAAYVLTRALTVTSLDTTRGRGGRR